MTGVGDTPRDLQSWMRDVNKRLVAQERRRVNGATWEGIADKPSTFPPSSHTHDWGQISDKPTTFPPSAHTHDWGQITGVPSADGATPNTIALRNAQGQIGVGEPTTAGHAATKAYVDSTVLAAAPPGVILPYGGSSAPSGYLLCQGQAVSRSTYAALFAVLGTTYGAGDGSSTFNLPDMRGRVPVGLDVGQAEFNALGNAGGAKTHTLTEAEMPSHTHYIDGPLGAVLSGTSREPVMNGSDGAGYMPWFGGGWGAAPARVHASGSSQPHNNLQPYITLNYIIKT